MKSNNPNQGSLKVYKKFTAANNTSKKQLATIMDQTFPIWIPGRKGLQGRYSYEKGIARKKDSLVNEYPFTSNQAEPYTMVKGMLPYKRKRFTISSFIKAFFIALLGFFLGWMLGRRKSNDRL